MKNQIIPQIIKTEARLQKVSQKQLALAVDCSESTIKLFYNTGRNIGYKEFLVICKHLNINVDGLIWQAKQIKNAQKQGTKRSVMWFKDSKSTLFNYDLTITERKKG